MTDRQWKRSVVARSLVARSLGARWLGAWLLGALVATAGVLSPAWAGPPSILSMFQERSSAASEEKLLLKDEHGPWLILAYYTGGEDAEQQAIALAKELRQSLGAPTYVHRKEFDHSQPLAKSERVQLAGAEKPYAKVVRYSNASRDKTFAVLVGNYNSPDEPGVKEMLEKIKTAQPKTLAQKADEAKAQSPTAEKDPNWLISSTRKLMWQKSERNAKKGPMGGAFITRNPLLPDDYFQSSVDDFVVKINENVEHSLLRCPKRYTVRVATFNGKVVTELAGGSLAPKSKNSDELTDTLDKAAESAHLLTDALRKKGVEAYEFHDRNASYVCIGGFDTLGEEPAGGGPFVYNPEMVSIMNQYCGYTVRSFKDARSGRVTNTPTCKMIDNIPFDVEGKFISIPKPATSKLYQGSLLGKPRVGE